LACSVSLPPSGLTQAQEPLDLAPVKADNHLAVDDRDRSRPQSELLQFLQRLWIFSDVLRGKLDALLRKKLFLLVTGASPGLGIDNHLLRHDLLLASSRFWLRLAQKRAEDYPPCFKGLGQRE